MNAWLEVFRDGVPAGWVQVLRSALNVALIALATWIAPILATAGVAGIGGLVEEVTLRYVRLRDFEGHVHFVPNGEIKTVTNRTRDYAQALIEIGVAYRENVDAALAVMRAVGQSLRADATWSAKILDDVEIVGVERWADSAVMLRCRLKVVGIEQWNVKREFLRRLKTAFDARGIEIPFPHLTLYAGQAKDGSAPAFRIDPA